MSKRFTEANAQVLMAELHRRGVACEIVPPTTAWYGVDDPECPHPGIRFDTWEPMVSLRTPMSGRALHKIARKLGLVDRRVVTLDTPDGHVNVEIPADVSEEGLTLEMVRADPRCHVFPKWESCCEAHRKEYWL